MAKKPKIGDRTVCERCSQELEWNGAQWWDRGADTTCGSYLDKDREIVREDHTKAHIARPRQQ